VHELPLYALPLLYYGEPHCRCATALLFAASACLAQQYTVTDLGTLGGAGSNATGVNNLGQVVGSSNITGNVTSHAFRTAPNSPINPATDDLGTLGGSFSQANGINASGQVVGTSWSTDFHDPRPSHAFRTAPNSPINPATDDLNPFADADSIAYAINDSGQVVGFFVTAHAPSGAPPHAFRTAPNSNSLTDLGGLTGNGFPYFGTAATGINVFGQVVGGSVTNRGDHSHAFRTASNSPINPATDDLGTLGGNDSIAWGMNASGQVVGNSYLADNITQHAFRTAPNSPINPATDDLGTLGGLGFCVGQFGSQAQGINDSGQVVGTSSCFDANSNFHSHAFLFDGGVMHDLNNLIPAGSGWELQGASAINNAGQIAGTGTNPNGAYHAFLLTPIPYKAFVQPPINADGSSVFSAKAGGVIPVNFTLTENDVPTCTLPPATISVTRTSSGTVGVGQINNWIIYRMPADNGPNFRIDQKDCQYTYNLAASSLGVGTYRVDISINGIAVGHAVFALE